MYTVSIITNVVARDQPGTVSPDLRMGAVSPGLRVGGSNTNFHTSEDIIYESNSVEVIAGILAGGVGNVKDYNTKLGGLSRVHLDSNVDVSSYRKAAVVPIDKINKKTNKKWVKKGMSLIWMQSSIPFHYDLYQYKTSKFVQGILSVCNYFDKNIKDYIYQHPLNENLMDIDILGYHVKTTVISQIAPELSDVTEEEADDENILNPFARSDIIIF